MYEQINLLFFIFDRLKVYCPTAFAFEFCSLIDSKKMGPFLLKNFI